jgi:Na+-transporting NADH:ubiquinone oxidoreductase subunit NqrB
MSSASLVAPPALKPQGRFQQIKPFLAPFLITCILAGGQYKYGILEGDLFKGTPGTLAAILVSIVFEMAMGRFATGRWPHLASAYITGISVGILLRTPLLWPYVVCSLLSISSKYALRVKNRHLWNPSNLGVSLLLFFVPGDVVPLSLQWGNDIWVPIIIMCLGTFILFTIGRLHITLTYVAAFCLLAPLRSAINGFPVETELGVLLVPSYLLFMIFMITDPKTTTRTWPRQCAVASLVAVVDTILRLGRETHAPYYALFMVAPITNLLEIWWDSRCAKESLSLGSDGASRCGAP